MSIIESGLRRNNNDLEIYKKDKRENKFILVDQPNFLGSKEMLETMQDYERLYREGKPSITDEEWDELVKKTNYIESLDNIVSPSGRRWVSLATPLMSLGKVVSMKAFDDYIDKFDCDTKFIVGPKLDGLTYSARYLKINSKDYKSDYYLSDISTRGDGINGLSLHDKALFGVDIKGLPDTISYKDAKKLESLNCIVNEVIEIRGEAVIDRFKYCKENKLDPNTLVARTIAAGIFNRKEPSNYNYIVERINVESKIKNQVNYDDLFEGLDKDDVKMLGRFGIIGRKLNHDRFVIVNEVAYARNRKSKEWAKIEDPYSLSDKIRREHLDFISFSISSKDGNIDRPEILKSIPEVIYVSIPESLSKLYDITSDKKRIIELIDDFYGTINFKRDLLKERKKSTLNYACDGMVIKPENSDRNSQKLDPVFKSGKIVIPNKPNDQIAIKLSGEKTKTKILKIIETKTNLGNITVRAEIEPTIVEGGAQVKSVNLHNKNWMSLPENAWIKEGAKCYVSLSMDIIPILSETL